MNRRRLSVVCVSGGLDSAVTASIAAAESEALAFLHVNYGQRTEQRELACYNDLADHFGVRHRLAADVSYLRTIGGSSLTDPSLEVENADLERASIPGTYVPFRNAHLLAIATSWGEVLGADALYIGAVAEDSSGYPDCRPEFYRAFQALLDAGTKPDTDIRVMTPVIGLSKADIIRRGAGLGTPFELTWSCYRAETAACGRCDSCALRLRGFRQAGLSDPIPYENVL